MKNSIIIICLYSLCTCFNVQAQKRSIWLVKIGINRSNLYYNHLPTPESSLTVLTTGDTIYTTGLAGGWNNYRWGINAMGYYERNMLKWLNIGIGIGYRQKGYTAQKYAYKGRLEDRDIAMRLHYLSSELSLRLKPTKYFYFLINNRFDALIASKSSPENQYIANNIKSWEIFSSIGLGREIPLGSVLGLLEIEIGRSLSNISNFSSSFYRQSTDIWNVSYSINFGIKF